MIDKLWVVTITLCHQTHHAGTHHRHTHQTRGEKHRVFSSCYADVFSMITVLSCLSASHQCSTTPMLIYLHLLAGMSMFSEPPHVTGGDVAPSIGWSRCCSVQNKRHRKIHTDSRCHFLLPPLGTSLLIFNRPILVASLFYQSPLMALAEL